jgi:hypothetical protein
MPSEIAQKQRQIPLKKPYQCPCAALVDRRSRTNADHLIRFLSMDLSLFPRQPITDHGPIFCRPNGAIP